MSPAPAPRTSSDVLNAAERAGVISQPPFPKPTPAEAAPLATTEESTAPSLRASRVAPPTTVGASRLGSPAPSTTAGDGGYFVQLGAYSTDSFARRMWAEKTTRQPSLLRGLTYRVVRDERRRNGDIYYLLQAGPMTAVDADMICMLHLGECIVIEP